MIKIGIAEYEEASKVSKEILNPQATFYKKNNHTYMKLEFDGIINGKKVRYLIPKIDFESFTMEIDTQKLYHENVFITDFGSFAELKFDLCSLDGRFYTTKNLEPKEMTVKEIEKELGYKIKITG